jgi:predicted dinucleotide-binding enzyme
MKIGSIGKGNVGGALTRLWQQAGHDVRAGGRDDSLAEVAAHGDVVLLAVDAGAVEDVLQAAGPLDGKILIDATNDIDAKFGSLAGRVAELAPGAKVGEGLQCHLRSRVRRGRAAGPAPKPRLLRG